MRAVLRIAGFSIMEVMRRKIFLAVLLLTAGFLLLYFLGAYYAFEQINEVDYGDMAGGMSKRDILVLPTMTFAAMGVFVCGMIGALLSTFASVGTVSSEVEQGVLQVMMTRPVKRWQVILGKFLGLGAMLYTYLFFLFLMIMGIISYQSTIILPNILSAALIFSILSLVLLSFSLFGSTFLSTVSNGVVVLTFYSVALIGGMIEQFGAAFENKVMVKLGIISSLLMPSDSVYRFAVQKIQLELPIGVVGTQGSNFALGPFGVTSAPSVYMLAWIGFYIVVFLSFSMYIFSRKDL